MHPVTFQDENGPSSWVSLQELAQEVGTTPKDVWDSWAHLGAGEDILPYVFRAGEDSFLVNYRNVEPYMFAYPGALVPDWDIYVPLEWAEQVIESQNSCGGEYNAIRDEDRNEPSGSPA